MAPAEQIASAGFSLAAALCWGTSDFSGGYASKRSDAFLVTMLSHASGFVLMLTLAVLSHSELPSRSSQLWAAAGGMLGGLALVFFYRALSGGMGLVAPVAAVLGAAIPTGFTMITQGLPSMIAIAGFLLAGVGIWLISRPDDSGNRRGIYVAALAGIGFAGFFLCISRTGESSALWSATFSRCASFLLVGTIVLLRRNHGPVRSGDAMIGLVAGCLDVTGTALFIRANQTGRLDSAVVLSSLYPALTVLLARLFLKERFTPWKTAGIVAAVLAVPMIALQ